MTLESLLFSNLFKVYILGIFIKHLNSIWYRLIPTGV